MFRALLCPSSGAQDYTDGCGMWYIILWLQVVGLVRGYITPFFLMKLM
jgi:hypothetical protein